MDARARELIAASLTCPAHGWRKPCLTCRRQQQLAVAAFYDRWALGGIANQAAVVREIRRRLGVRKQPWIRRRAAG